MPVTQTRRILSVFRSADAQQLATGLAWYDNAHAEAERIALANGLSLAQAAGIIAALSPQTSWGHNVFWAEAIATGDYTSRGLGRSQARAIEIACSPDVDPLDILGGPKVRAFYLAILERGLTDAVVIDRHAYDLAENARGSHVSLTAHRLKVTAESYRGAAKRLQSEGVIVTACQLQAITWITWRARYWSEGAWDGYTVDRGRAPETESVAF